MDLLKACEDLAANVAAFDYAGDNDSSHVSDADSTKWKKLFGFSTNDEAAKAIRGWRADFARQTIPQAAWLLVKEAKVAEGFNKESYEYGLWRAQAAQQPRAPSQTSNNNRPAGDEAKYLVKLECDSSESTGSVDLLYCLPKSPSILTGVDDNKNITRFCLLTGSQKIEFLDAVSKAYPTYKPTLIRTSIAAKDLSSSLFPTLGVDATLPQFRSSSPSEVVRPTQNEYPVWYFFYGTLADADILSRVIGRPEDKTFIETCYKRARIHRGRLSTLGDRYLALVDGDGDSTVDGWAYQVKDQHEEDSLRVYETGKYEVVRCMIEVLDGQRDFLKGLTFRLAKSSFFCPRVDESQICY
ncbi:hypothetical protein V8C26DRAFT_397912 [Trichoderma gracile]